MSKQSQQRLYIVQFKDEPHEPVGVFWASSLWELAVKADTCGDPQYFEYAELPEGESMSLEGEASEDCPGDPWGQPIRKWTQLEGMDPVRLRWRPLKTQLHYERK